MPGLTFTHFFSTTVVVTDIRYTVDNLFTIKLHDDTEGTVRRWVVRAQVEEHKVLIIGTAFHAPVFWFEGHAFHFQIFFLLCQLKRIELGSTRRVIFTQRMAFPALWHHDTCQVWVPNDINTEHFPGFALIPVGVGKQPGDGRNMQIVFGQCHLEHDVAITFNRNEMVENRKIRGR